MLAALGVLALAGCTSSSIAPRGTVAEAAGAEPLNLSVAKAAVVAYHDSGAYARGVEAVAQALARWVEERAKRRAANERLAVVFDIDETALSNYPHMLAQDFGYVPGVWEEWVARAEAPALAPVRRAYGRARELGIAVIFVTGRRDPGERSGTVENLAREGMGDYERLVLTPVDDRRPAAVRKAEIRAGLEREGFTIIASIGDQQSDLVGGHAERVFKLPNPFYEIP